MTSVASPFEPRRSPALLALTALLACNGEPVEPFTLDLTVRYQAGQEDLFDGRDVQLLVGPPAGVIPTLYPVGTGAHGVQLDLADIPAMEAGTRVGLLAEEPGGTGGQWTPELTAGYGDILLEEPTAPGETLSLEILVPAIGEIGSMGNIASGKRRMNAGVAVAPSGAVYVFGGVPGTAIAADASDQILVLSGVDEGDTTFDAIATKLPDTKGEGISGGDVTFAGRCTHQATLLSDGRILVTGGRPNYLEPWSPSDQWLIFDPTTEDITEKGKLPEPRMEHVAIRFQGGRVLLYGGSTSNLVETVPTFSIFDPERSRADAGLAIEANATGINRMFGAPLGSDAVVCGGDSNEQFADGQDWTPVPGCVRVQPTGDVTTFDPLPVALSGATMTQLRDGGLLVVGGFTDPVHDVIDGGYVKSVGSSPARTGVYRWTEGGGWAHVADLAYARAHHSARVLADGRVLVVGGDERGGALFAEFTQPVLCPELYDPATDTVSAFECTDTGSGAYNTLANADGTDIFVASGYVYGGVDLRGLDQFGYTAYGPPLALP